MRQWDRQSRPSTTAESSERVRKSVKSVLSRESRGYKPRSGSKPAPKPVVPKPEWIDIIGSDHIRAVKYDPAPEKLFIRFFGKENPTYVYSNVSQTLAEGIIAADSAGTYFYKYILGKPVKQIQ